MQLLCSQDAWRSRADFVCSLQEPVTHISCLLESMQIQTEPSSVLQSVCERELLLVQTEAYAPQRMIG